MPGTEISEDRTVEAARGNAVMSHTSRLHDHALETRLHMGDSSTWGVVEEAGAVPSLGIDSWSPPRLAHVLYGSTKFYVYPYTTRTP